MADVDDDDVLLLKNNNSDRFAGIASILGTASNCS